MSRELRIKHNELGDSQTITGIMEHKFREAGLDLHMNDVLELTDDYDSHERVLKVSTRKYFTPK
jgi:hypothetical protein